MLDAMTGSTRSQPFSGQRDHMGVVVLDGRIHAIAGRMDSYDFNTSMHGVWDPKSNEWDFRAPLPTTRSSICAAVYRGKIVTFGGEATGKVYGTNEIYDPSTDQWYALTPMHLPRHGLHGAGAAVIGDFIHVPGGGVIPGGSIQSAYHDAFTLS
jgi:N-acetylneuraminic acid mutarotase